jgi:hypothetical protein
VRTTWRSRCASRAREITSREILAKNENVKSLNRRMAEETFDPTPQRFNQFNV